MNKTITFEKALEKLAVLVSQLEKGNLSLDQSLKLYEEGIALTAFCEKELSGAKLKLSELQGSNSSNEKETGESDE